MSRRQPAAQGVNITSMFPCSIKDAAVPLPPVPRQAMIRGNAKQLSTQDLSPHHTQNILHPSANLPRGSHHEHPYIDDDIFTTPTKGKVGRREVVSLAVAAVASNSEGVASLGAASVGVSAATPLAPGAHTSDHDDSADQPPDLS